MMLVMVLNSSASALDVRQRLQTIATSILREVPFEDGEHHPLEEHLLEVLEEHSGSDWVVGLWNDYKTDSPGMAATLLRCLGMLPLKLTRDWGHDIASEALKSRSLRIREAPLG